MMRIPFLFVAAITLLSASVAYAQINIIEAGDGIIEYSLENAVPYDSLAPFHQSYKNYPMFPGQTLFFQGKKNDASGYADAFYTANPLKGNSKVYHAMNERVGNTSPDAVVGKYFDVLKVFCKQNSRYCLLLKEQKTGDEIYYLPSISTTNNFICIGNYEKMKQLHVSKTFYALGKRVELVDGNILQPSEGTEYKAIGMGVELHDNGAFLILEDNNGQRLKGRPYGHIVAGFVSKERLDSLIERYGKDYGERISFMHITEGMSKEMLVESLGSPIKKEQTTFKGKSADIWRYPEGYIIGLQNDKVISVHKNSYLW